MFSNQCLTETAPRNAGTVSVKKQMRHERKHSAVKSRKQRTPQLPLGDSHRTQHSKGSQFIRHLLHSTAYRTMISRQQFGKFWYKCFPRASLVGQWLRIRLPMQGTRVWALVREDPTCRRATGPVSHNYWAWEPQLLSLCATTTETHAPRDCALQQEKPLQWEACTPQRRVAPLAATRESPRTATKTQHSQK